MKLKRNLILTFLALFLTNTSNAQDLTEYILSIERENPFTVNIKVIFHNKVDILKIHPACPNYDYPNGWSTFIKPITPNLIFVENSNWAIDNKRELTYEVDLSFVKETWDVGNEQAGIYIENSLFVVTRALFLTNKEDTQFKVTFNLPEEYSVATPWTPISKNQFLVNSNEELTNNTLVWGLQRTETINVGDFSLQFALLGYNQNVSDLVMESFKAILDNYIEIFPETPKSHYLITVFPAEQNDGEAYTTSNAFTLKYPLSDQNIIIWGNQFAHELFHFWNGRMINGPERSKRQWFSEGFTEYFGNLALIQSGSISENDFYRLIEKTIGLYYYFRNRQHPEVSLVSAGSNKSKYRFGVYNGGWCAAFVMDMMIREKFPDKTLDDFMSILFTKFGLTGDDYILEDLESEFNEFFESEEDTYFSKYISGIEELPVEQYFNKMGISLDYTSYEGTAFLFDFINSEKDQVLLKNRWLKK